MLRILSILPALVLAVVAAGCGSDPVTEPPDPAVLLTETFSGTIPVNGASVSTFTEAKAGSVTVTVTAVSPDDTVTFGLWLGTWNGISCAAGVAKEDAKLSSVLFGTASGPGMLCIRVYDNRALTQPTDFELKVEHY
jgi:hypothetical protein